MEDIVYEIIGGAVILGVIIMVISIFRTSGDTIKNAAESQSELDAISIVESIGYEGMVYPGSKIIDTIAYAEVTPGIEVVFPYNGGTATFNSPAVGTSADASTIQAYKNALLYNTSNRYKLESIEYFSGTSQVDDEEVKQGFKGISSIRFTYAVAP